MNTGGNTLSSFINSFCIKFDVSITF